MACFQEVGNRAEEIERLKMSVSGTASAFAAVFISQLEIPSGPTDELFLSFAISSSVSSVEIKSQSSVLMLSGR